MTEERARIPVPVLFTLHGWDPNSELLVDWLASGSSVTTRCCGPENTAAMLRRA